MKTYHYWLVADTGARTAIEIEDRSESTANAEAKIEAERWMSRLGLTPGNLIRFDLAFVTPV